MKVSVALISLLVLPTLIISAALGSEAPKKAHDRVVHTKEFSDHAHYDDEGEHEEDYDHDAFLGEELSDEFDRLDPDESVRRLGVIVDKIDSDKDGFVTLAEMQAWIKGTQKKYVEEDVDRQWKDYGMDAQGKLSWEAYRQKVFGFVEQEKPREGAEKEFEDDMAAYRKMEDRDRRRWGQADQDKDGFLNREEFGNFLHPEEAAHMRDLVVTETFEDIDKDKDGKITLEEYIGDMYRAEDKTDDQEPDWVAAERAQFAGQRDKNNDGYMDFEEVRAWIMPEDFDHSEAESKHLINEADANADGKLSKDEILDKYDLFVGSQATSYGEALTQHDEF